MAKTLYERENRQDDSREKWLLAGRGAFDENPRKVLLLSAARRKFACCHVHVLGFCEEYGWREGKISVVTGKPMPHAANMTRHDHYW